MRMTWQINKPPAEIIVPSDCMEKLRYIPGAKQHAWDVSTILPVLYPHDPLLPLLDKPGWTHDPYPKIKASDNLFVRRFNEAAGAWGPWIEGKIMTEWNTNRPIGTQRTYLIEYEGEDGPHCEEFLPYVGEVWDPTKFKFAMSDKIEDYYCRRRELNLVYIPILSHVTGLDGSSDTTIIFYVGQVLYTDARCTEWHVRVMNGPYAGQVMRATQVYSYDLGNARAIMTGDNRELIFERLLGKCRAVRLAEQDIMCVVLPGAQPAASIQVLQYMDDH